MREIKFRAWDKTHKKMFIRFFYISNMGHIYVDGDPYGMEMSSKRYMIPTDSLILMQYTGLKDKNGKEIYEGDILKCNQFKPLVEIRWDPERVCLSMWSNDHSEFYWKDFESWIFLGNVLTNLEIIGNIYENPELIGDRK